MIAVFRKIYVCLAALTICSLASAQSTEQINVAGLEKPVEILKDRWGISHIYAETEHDLFCLLYTSPSPRDS